MWTAACSGAGPGKRAAALAAYAGVQRYGPAGICQVVAVALVLLGAKGVSPAKPSHRDSLNVSESV